jgi:hypothetical protein
MITGPIKNQIDQIWNSFWAMRALDAVRVTALTA